TAEDLTPVLALAQAVRGVERMAGLMAQDAHQPAAAATLHLLHETALQPHQARLRKIERQGDAGHAIRREPLLGIPVVRTETHTATAQLAIETLHVFGDDASAARQLDVAKAQRE